MGVTLEAVTQRDVAIALTALDLLGKECETAAKSLDTLGLPTAQVVALRGQSERAAVELNKAAARAREAVEAEKQSGNTVSINGGDPVPFTPSAFFRVVLESEPASALATGLLIYSTKCSKIAESQLKLGIEPADTTHKREDIERLRRKVTGNAELFDDATGEVVEAGVAGE